MTLKIYNAYTQERPSVELLRHPVLFGTNFIRIRSSLHLELLIRDLFNPMKTVNSTHKSKYFFVLAYAATAVDGDPAAYVIIIA